MEEPVMKGSVETNTEIHKKTLAKVSLVIWPFVDT